MSTELKKQQMATFSPRFPYWLKTGRASGDQEGTLRREPTIFLRL
jgi:hypothetical protein